MFHGCGLVFDDDPSRRGSATVVAYTTTDEDTSGRTWRGMIVPSATSC